MANRFDIVSVWTNDESGVVIRMIVRAQTGGTVVSSAGFECSVIEGVHLPPISGRECQMQWRRFFVALEQAQRSLASRAHFDAV